MNIDRVIGLGVVLAIVLATVIISLSIKETPSVSTRPVPHCSILRS